MYKASVGGRKNEREAGEENEGERIERREERMKGRKEGIEEYC